MKSASIVIPVFNRAHLVHRAIDTALAQTLPCEVILVDHGSSDAIGEVVRQYEGRIRYIRRETDQGPVHTWRDGIEQATGEYIHLTYDDDWLAPTFMERCLDAMQDDVGFVYTRALVHFEGQKRDEPAVLHPAGRRPIGPLVQHLLWGRFTVSPGCAVFRKADALNCLLPEVPGAKGRYGAKSGVGEDLLLFLLTTLKYPYYVHIDAFLADFLGHAGSITMSALSEGRARLLAQAYEHAKQFYLAQPGALRRERGLRRATNLARWVWESKALEAYARKGLQRLW